MNTGELITGVSAAVLLYIYIGYPILVAGLAWIGRRRPRRRAGGEADAAPSVSIVISTRDSAAELLTRLENLLGLDYPGQIEILIGADEAPEAYATARKFPDPRVRAFELPRSGKARTQNLLIAHATGEVIVTTDAQTRFGADFLRLVVQDLTQPGIGAVTGIMHIVNRGESGTAGTEAGYWSYEQWLRQQESDAGVLIGAVGACFAFWRRLYRPINPASDTDNMTPQHVVEQGYRVVQCPRAVVTEEAIPNPRAQLRNRRRTVTRSFVDYVRCPQLLNPLRYPAACWCIVSHKLLRWLTPYFLLTAWLSCLFWRHSGPGLAMFGAGLLALAAGGVGVARGRSRPLPGWWAMLASPVGVNLAFLLGTFNVARGVRIERW